MPSLRDLMTAPLDTFERPPAMPAGHYTGTILGFEFGKTTQKQTDYIRVFLKAEAAGDDVQDTDALGKIDLSRRELRKDFFILENTMWRLREFVDAVLGPAPGRNLDERLPDIKNARVLIQVTQRPDPNNAENIYNDVGTIVAA